MARTIVGILRGGTSSEYELSLRTGANFLAGLPESEYEVRDILIDRVGVWHIRGIPMEPMRALSQMDVVLNGLHGGIGEDGTIARILEQAGVGYAGSRPLPSAISLNKLRAREVLRAHGVMMPRAVSFTINNELSTADMAQAVFSSFGPPYIVKPTSDGGSSGVQFVATIIDLPNAIADVLEVFGAVLVEEFIAGQEASVGVVDDFRNEELYALPPAEIRMTRPVRFQDTHALLNADHEIYAPSSFSHSEKDELMNLARAAHRALALSHYSRADIILSKRGPYLLEVNALPGVYNGASLPVMLEAVGASTGDFAKHLIERSRKGR